MNVSRTSSIPTVCLYLSVEALVRFSEPQIHARFPQAGTQNHLPICSPRHPEDKHCFSDITVEHPAFRKNRTPCIRINRIRNVDPAPDRCRHLHLRMAPMQPAAAAAGSKVADGRSYIPEIYQDVMRLQLHGFD